MHSTFQFSSYYNISYNISNLKYYNDDRRDGLWIELKVSFRYIAADGVAPDFKGRQFFIWRERERYKCIIFVGYDGGRVALVCLKICMEDKSFAWKYNERLLYIHNSIQIAPFVKNIKNYNYMKPYKRRLTINITLKFRKSSVGINYRFRGFICDVVSS